MTSVTIGSATNGSTVDIQTTTSSMTALAQSALDAISAQVASGALVPLTYTPGEAIQSFTGYGELMVASAASLTITSTDNVTAIVDDATAPVTIADETSETLTIVGGAGGLIFNGAQAGGGPAVIIAAGGTNDIAIGSGGGTVGVDGVSTVNALGGGTDITTASDGISLVEAGGTDTVNLAGTDTLAFAAAASEADVTLQDQANVVFTDQSGSPSPIVSLDAGTQTLGTGPGSTATVSGSAGGMMLVSAWGGRTFIDPGADNVTVFAGSGTETLFGTGDDTMAGVTVPSGGALSNSGSDFVFDGNGYFHGGSGELNMLMTSTLTGAATLAGGGAVDILFSQGAGDSLKGAAGTVVMDAAGFSEPGFSVAGASGGDVLNAGSSNAFMFGAAWGSNTIVSGSGAATVYGNHGASGKVGDIYIDGGKAGSLAILDFLPGADVVALDGATIVNATPSAGATPGTTVSLSDGTQIVFVDETLTPNQIAAAFR